MKIQRAARAGFTLVEIMIVVAIIGLLAAIAIPNLVHARETTQTNECIANLRQIDGAAQTYALEHNKLPNDTYTLNDIKSYLKRDLLPECPAGGAYGPGYSFGAPPWCTAPDHVLP
jgi:prepilin-type N-terminal cleavage/methylation domain-containing protein